MESVNCVSCFLRIWVTYHACHNIDPLASFSAINKLSESIIIKNVLEHLNRNNLLSDNQYGFRPASSSDVVLTVITHIISKTLDNKFLKTTITLDM